MEFITLEEVSFRSKAVRRNWTLPQFSDPLPKGGFPKSMKGCFGKDPLRALGMGSGKEADATQECSMLPVYSVQRDVGAVAKRV